ncbi:hypothetical protein FIBSPDRAFT_901393 [Athelia psychrophila]|uniref:Uncharacterized protein n=1 Tax=Athelia psychrophila TaxID=1759441 RepID=A0A165X679_9AGAM|nr:hypothetical protein FIBSPDRAFT_901393 [Fibularhizoctonia sp. CBS 109695]
MTILGQPPGPATQPRAAARPAQGPTQGTVLSQLHNQIMGHFNVHGLTLPPGDWLWELEDFGTLPWPLVKMKKHKNAYLYLITCDGSIYASDVNMSALKARQACNNPGSTIWQHHPTAGDTGGEFDWFTLLAAPPKVQDKMYKTV